MTKGTGILRDNNKRRILSLIRQLKQTTRQDLVQYMDVSKNTVSLIVDEFINDEIVKEVGVKTPGTRGRPKVILEINRNSYKALGFFIKKNGIDYMVTDYYNRVIEENFYSVDGENPDDVKKQLMTILVLLIKKYPNIIGATFGIPGIVDCNNKFIHKSTHLGWNNVSFEEFEQLEIPIYINNSVNVGALVSLDAAFDTINKSFFYVRVSEGVGGAYIVDNQIMNGDSWTAGEIGHISIDPNGEKCRCGQRGCLEHTINLEAFQNKTKGLSIHNEGFNDDMYHLLEVQVLMKEFGVFLGKALIPVYHLINPFKIIIDTPYNHSKDFKDSCLSYLSKNVLPFPYDKTDVIFTKEQSNICKGAALMSIINFEKGI